MTTPLTPIPARIEDLKGDVAQVAPTDGKALVWVASTAKWTPTAIAAPPVSSVFGRTGAVVAAVGDYSVSQVTGAAIDSAVVHKTGTETIAGAKTFTGTVTLPVTAGSVLFAGTGGVLSQDNAALFWDAVNKFLGLGTPTPARQLHLEATTNQYLRLKSGANKDSAIEHFDGVTFVYAGMLGEAVGPGIWGIFNNRVSLIVIPTGNVLVNATAPGSVAAMLESKAANASTSAAAFYSSDGASAWVIGPKGEGKPPQLADSAASNKSIYHSTTAGKLVYKDPSGTVNPLY